LLLDGRMPRIAGMKTILVVAALLIGITAFGGAAEIMGKNKELRHVVLFKFKEGTTAEQVKQVEDAFGALPAKIKLIKGFEWGTNVSPENLAQGYTHCFLLTFSSDKDRDAYLVDPAHKEFGNLLKPYLEKVLVVDFWARE
jgi:Stress responsive A/B Barrel Domain